ncbi:MAG: O-antigen ligase family protein [Trichloromonadaceae bacterium]
MTNLHFQASAPHDSKNFSSSLFILVLVYFLIYVGQFHVIIAPIAKMRPGMIVTLAIILFLCLNWTKISILENRKFVYIILFTCLLFILSIFSRNTHNAFMTGFSMVLMLPFLLSIIYVLNDKNRILWFFRNVEFIMLILSIYSIMNKGKGPGGIVYDENDLALFLVLAIPFSIFFYVNSENKLTKFYHVFVIFTALIAIVNSNSRGAVVGMAFMLFVYCILSKKKFVTFIGVFLIAIVVYCAGGNEYLSEIKSISEYNKGTASERMLSWDASWNMFLDHPLGIGGNNFQILFQEYQSEELRKNMWGRLSHSLWFTLIPELGIGGLIIYGKLFLFNLKEITWLLKRHLDFTNNKEAFYGRLGISFMASFAGFFGAASFVSVLYYPHFWYLTCALSGVINVARGDIRSR